MTAPTGARRTMITDRLARAQWAGPVAGGAALLLSCTALSGVITGVGWFGYLAGVIGLVVGTGIGLRALAVPALLAVVGQVASLTFLLTAVFTGQGGLGFLPTPDAFREFQVVLSQAGDQVQTGVPPVPGTFQITCLAVVAIGLVAVVVDVLIVVSQAPAVAGLALLCVFAVPAALANALLPWWTFVLGAVGFAVLLAVDGQHRHQAWRRGFGRGRARSGVSGVARSAAGVAVTAVVIGLFVGSTFTAVGTSGRLPFGDQPGANSVGVRLNPFTSLGGQLRRGRPIELFKVHGMDQNVYLKALTLASFSSKAGWSQGKLDAKTRLGPNAPLPQGMDALPPGQVKTVTIDPIGYRDVWLPNYGVPLGFDGIPQGSSYDQSAGVAFTQSRLKLQPYQERLVVPQPTPQDLRSTTGTASALIDPQYFHYEPVDPRVTDLAVHLSAGGVTDFDRTLAINRYFTDGTNGFTYSLDAGDGSSNDALVNFLFTTKKGFCEQYASAMAIMLRLIGIPSRVVLGFTPGSQSGDARTITTNDAHAWVEVFFPTVGWTTFDPTPLADGRGAQPSYVTNDGTIKPGQQPDGGTGTTSAPATTTTPKPSGPATSSVVAAPAGGGPGDGGGAGRLAGRLLATLLCVVGAALITGDLLAARNPRLPAKDTVPVTAPRLLRAAAGPGLVAVGLGTAVALTWSNAVQTWLWALTAVVLSALACLAMPVLVRTVRRAQRVRLVTLHSPGSAAAAWAELRAESVDRGGTVLPSETVRAAARRIAREHHLDEAGRDGLRTIIGIVEREWYGGYPATDVQTGAQLRAAFDAVRDALRRGAPLSVGARLWPASVLRAEVRPEDAEQLIHAPAHAPGNAD